MYVSVLGAVALREITWSFERRLSPGLSLGLPFLRSTSTSFFVHHTQRMALAAQLHDAIAIRREIGSRKQLHMSRIAGGAL